MKSEPEASRGKEEHGLKTGSSPTSGAILKNAVMLFASTGHILYHYALPMAACQVIGSVAGTRVALWKGNRFVRALFLVVVSALILRFGWRLFFEKPANHPAEPSASAGRPGPSGRR